MRLAVKKMWILCLCFTFEKKTYLWIVCYGIYEGQGGLGEESTWTICNHWGCSSDQGLMSKVFHLLQTEDQYFNSPQTKYEEQEHTFFWRFAAVCVILSLTWDLPTCANGTAQSPRATWRDVMLMCTASVLSPNFWTPVFLLLNRTLSVLQ